MNAPFDRQATVRFAVAAMLLTCLASCSVTYEVAHVNPDDAKESNPGVYYMLPKTQLLAVLSMAKTTQTPARFSPKAWKACVAECINGEADSSCKAVPAAPVDSYDITAAKIYARTRADSRQLYRVNVDFDTFAAFTHSFKISEQGVLTTASAELENKAVEIAINTTKAIAKLAVTAGTLSAAPDAEELECPSFEPLYRAQVELDQRTESAREQFLKSLYGQPALNAAAIDILKAGAEQKIDTIRGEARYAEVISARKSSSETKVLGDYAMMIEPEGSWPGPAGWQPIQALDLEGFAGLQSVPSDPDTKAEVLERLGKLSIEVERAIAFPAAAVAEVEAANARAESAQAKVDEAKNNNGQRNDVAAAQSAADVAKTQAAQAQVAAAKAHGEADKAKAGFRYRVPVSATIRIVETSDSQPKTILASASVLVAQFGALVSLPAEVKGIKSKIVLDMYETTGAPKQLDVGATPQPTTLVGDVLGPLQEELDRRVKANADKKAAAEGAEIADLTKQRDVLKLQKEIQDLKDALKAGEDARE